MRDLSDMPWVGEDEVFDLSNTIALSGTTDPNIDFFANESLTQTWRSRALARDLAILPLDELIQLRRWVRAALDAADRGAKLPDAARSHLNRLSASAPITLALDSSDILSASDIRVDPQGRIARKTLELVARSRVEPIVRRCLAPGCGMFFSPRRTDQAWCTIRCGTRARAARRRTAQYDIA